jgi:peptide chain release factor 1
LLVLEVRGKDAGFFFAHESGGHRWQRVPPNEKRGRRHTSTVTVAVMPVLTPLEQSLNARDLEWKAVRTSTSAGGQKRDKTSSAVQMTHKPTGISVRVQTSRSQIANRESAERLIIARLAEHAFERMDKKEAEYRRRQIGSGMRGDKIRTIRMQDDTVTNHLNGKTMSAARYLKGDVASLAC